MKQLITLLQLQLSVLKNQYLKRNNNKTITIVLLSIIFLLFLSFFGYSAGYLINNYSDNSKLGDLSDAIQHSFNTLISSLVIANIFSNRKILKQINYRNLRFLPINFFLFLSVDLAFSIFNKINIYIYCLLLGLIVGVSNSIEHFLYLFFIISTLLLLIHIFVELFDTLNSLFRVKATILYLGLVIVVILLSIFNLSKLYVFLKVSPIWLTLQGIIFPHNANIGTLIFNNIIYFVIGLIIYLFLKWLDFSFAMQNNKLKSPSLINERNKYISIGIFKNTLAVLIQKDIKYILRSSRVFRSIIFEILLVIICVLAYYYQLDLIFQDKYFMSFFLIVFSTLLWDYYLSNQWGLEKKAFGLYLFTNIKVDEIILAKNLSYFILKIPLLIISTCLFGFFISLELIPFVILLQLITNLLYINISNYNSIKYPYPTDLSENILSRAPRNIRFSIVGFLGLVMLMTFPAIPIYFIWKFNENIIILVVLLVIALLAICIYVLLLKTYSKSFYERREEIYKALCSEE